MDARIAMIAITTSSSISVNPARPPLGARTGNRKSKLRFICIRAGFLEHLRTEGDAGQPPDMREAACRATKIR
jgi:hypothetical protein